MSRATGVAVLVSLAAVAGVLAWLAGAPSVSAMPGSGQSPGRLIAFLKYPGEGIVAKNAGIFVKNSAGGPARRVTRDGFWPVWSPDGKWIAFIARRNVPKQHACRYDDRVACPAEIYVVRTDGTGERRLPSAQQRVLGFS